MTRLLEAPRAAGAPGPPDPAAARPRRPLATRLKTPALYACTLSAAFGIAAILIAIVGKSPWDAAVAMYDGSLGSGASIGQSVDQAAPLLMVAVEEANLPAVELLVARGAPVNERDAHGATALALATQMGFEEAVVILLGAGADPNIADESGMTPLDVAEEHGAHDIAALILRRGGKPSRDLDLR